MEAQKTLKRSIASKVIEQIDSPQAQPSVHSFVPSLTDILKEVAERARASRTNPDLTQDEREVEAIRINRLFDEFKGAKRTVYQGLIEQALTNPVAYAIFKGLLEENAQLRNEIEQGKYDRLTNLLRKDVAKAVFEREHEREVRHPAGLSFVYADIDKFKPFNDTYGHQIGDQVLAYVAGLIKDNVRKIDIPARWGGEEMVVLLPQTDIEGAYTVADKVRQKIEAGRVDTEKGILQVTASFGVAQLQKGESLENLEKRADKALYQAKEGGRNQVIAYSN